MTDEAALRAAIAQSPHDWTPRLVLADYLDDHGTEPHHAEEAARIRQAADPSTPLGRAVAASRTAMVASHIGRFVPTSGSERVERNITQMIHSPEPLVRRAAVHNSRQHHTFWASRHMEYGGFAGADHGKAAVAHGDARDALAEYARTL